MLQKQKNHVMAIVECEGFDYTFCSYSDFEEIVDEEFHEAREAYEEAAARLKKIIGFDDW